MSERETAGRRLRPEVDVCGLDGVEQQLGHTDSLHVDEMRLEEGFGGPETFPAYIHLTPVGKLPQRQGPVEYEPKTFKGIVQMFSSGILWIVYEQLISYLL